LPAMPASPPPHYWSLPEAIAWRLRRLPACTPLQAIGELKDLTGAVRIGAVAESANPRWPEDRKKKYQRANIGALVALTTDLLAEVNFELDVDATGAPVDFSITWKRAGILAFSAPRTERDPLIVAWLALLDQPPPEPASEAPAEPIQEAPAEPVQEAMIDEDECRYLKRIKKFGIPDKQGRWLPLRTLKRSPHVEGDEEWRKRKGISRAKMQMLRKKCRTGRPGAKKIIPK
jgi:hypothetical protein